MEKILVAIDGSEGCQKATKAVKELALLCNSSVTFITVVPNKTVTGFTADDIQKAIENKNLEKINAKQMINQCKNVYAECESYFENHDITANKVIKESDTTPSKVIYEFAEENNFDLIILADKSRGGVKKFLLGDTVEKVVRHSKVSVLVAK